MVTVVEHALNLVDIFGAPLQPLAVEGDGAGHLAGALVIIGIDPIDGAGIEIGVALDRVADRDHRRIDDLLTNLDQRQCHLLEDARNDCRRRGHQRDVASALTSITSGMTRFGKFIFVINSLYRFNQQAIVIHN
jgi:hypothetical protein